MLMIKKFFAEDIWDLDFNALTWIKKTLFGFVKIGFIVVRGYSRDRVSLRAAALTNITLMSMVPLIALMFSMAKGFGAGQKLNNMVTEHLANMPENVQEVVQQMLGYVENTNFGVLGAVGLLLLLYTVIAMLGRIESSFNAIWGIHEERTFFRKFSDYISIVLVVPILMLAATSINASLSSNSFVLMLHENVPFFAEVYERLASLTGTFILIINSIRKTQ